MRARRRAEQPDQPAGQDQPGRVDREPQQHGPAEDGQGDVSGSTRAARPSCQVTTAISASEAAFTPSRNAPAAGERRRRGTSGPLTATNTNAGRKMPSVATPAPGQPAQQVADEGGGREDRPRRDLADGDRVEQLRLGQPAPPLDEVGPQEGQQDVAAAEQHRADLEEEQEQRPAGRTGPPPPPAMPTWARATGTAAAIPPDAPPPAPERRRPTGGRRRGARPRTGRPARGRPGR